MLFPRVISSQCPVQAHKDKGWPRLPTSPTLEDAWKTTTQEFQKSLNFR